MANKKKPTAEEIAKQKKRTGFILLACGLVLVALLVIAVIDDVKTRKTEEAAAASYSERQEILESLMAGAEEAMSEATPGYAVSADDIEVSHYAEIAIKDYGTVKVALSEAMAPETVKNFVKLAESGFYDGLTFHRIMDGFMMQGGDPEGNGSGGSGENIKGEFDDNGVTNTISHVRGAISMARAEDPDSASSQFFIVQSDSTFLDGSYAGFGFVTEGMDVVDKICADAEPTDGNGTIKKEEQPVIEHITITPAGEE